MIKKICKINGENGNRWERDKKWDKIREEKYNRSVEKIDRNDWISTNQKKKKQYRISVSNSEKKIQKKKKK